jgi:hypothetical protein
VERGDFGLASGQRSGGTFGRVWFKELVPSEEVLFDAGTFLLLKAKAQALSAPTAAPAPPEPPTKAAGLGGGATAGKPGQPEVRIEVPGPDAIAVFAIEGTLPPEIWNKLGIRLIPTLKKGQGLTLTLSVAAETPVADREHFERELRRALTELSLGHWRVEVREAERPR